MTPLAGKKPIRRLSGVLIRDKGKHRAIIISLHGAKGDDDFIGLRLQGCKTVETYPINHLYSIAVKARVVRERAEKKAKRKDKWSSK